MSLYWATKAYWAGETPYQAFHFLLGERVFHLPYNLNPPSVFLFFAPLVKFSYLTSALFWFFLSVAAGLFSFYLCLLLLFPRDYCKDTWPFWIGLCAFWGPFLSNQNFLQLGSLLTLLIFGGYFLLQRQRDLWAGMLWGCAISIKWFPFLLVFYLISQHKWKALVALCCTCLIISLLPLYHHSSIYTDYFAMIAKIKWYGDSWNASLYGYCFRIFGAFKEKTHLAFFQISALCVLVVFFLGYLRLLYQNFHQKKPNEAFSWTLIMMLFLSPLGWYYYAILLVFPFLMLIEQRAFTANFLLSFFLLCFPIGYVFNTAMDGFWQVCVWYSLYFWALALLVYAFSRRISVTPWKSESEIYSGNLGVYERTLMIILSVSFLVRLLQLGVYLREI